MAPLLDVDSISAGYGKSQVLFDASLSVEEGELVGLIGANGAGKTTLLRCISGLLRPWRGTITFDGTRIDGRPPNEIVRLGIAHSPEGRRVFPDLTVHENLRMGAYARAGNWDEDLNRMMELFPRLRERQAQPAGTLSGGEQQMVAIARALMSSPRLLLLDEPSLGLAPVLVEQVMHVVEEIPKKEGTTTLLVEQNASFALSLADRSYVLEGGRFVKEGSGQELLRDEDVRSAYLGI
jgi:branched-chain amino acid transport system ATP-binding protein